MQKQSTDLNINDEVKQFRNYLSSLYPLDDDSWSAFADRLNYVEFKKGEIISKYGVIEQYVYFILKGAVRVYAQVNGQEYATNFRFDREYTSSITSFISRTPSIYNIEALTDVEALAMQYDDVQYLYEQYPAINTIGRKIIEALFMEKHHREVEFLSKSAEERYQNLCNRHPHFVQHIPGKYIASYLGISPETLSRIRAKN